MNASGVHFEDISNYAPEQIQDLLNKRESGEFSGNGVKEPWDFAHQTILSGRVNVAEGARNVYHVIYSRAEDDVTDSKGVVLDGLTIWMARRLLHWKDRRKLDEEAVYIPMA